MLKVLVDSDIDLQQIEWKPQMFYVEAYNPDTVPLDGNGNPRRIRTAIPWGRLPDRRVTVKDDKGNYILQLKPLYDVEFYPSTVSLHRSSRGQLRKRARSS